MTTQMLNDRDALIQATYPRFEDQGSGKLVLLVASAQLFKMPAAGGADPAPITLTALPLNLPSDDIVFGIVGGTLTGTGNARTLTYAAMTAPTAAITATVTHQGVAYTATQAIVKVADGGAGPRGSQTLYLFGGAWSDAAADEATTGPNQLGDTVTISNNGTFALTKTWNGTAWVAPGVVIDGKMLVTGSVSAAAINTNNLTLRAADGTLILGAGTALGGTYIANAAITTSKIGDAQITSAKIADAQITSAKIADAQITGAKIADAQITAAKIGDAEITSAKIANASITNAKIVNAAVDTLQLAGQAVTIPLSAASKSLPCNVPLTLTITSTGAPILILGYSMGIVAGVYRTVLEEQVTLYRDGNIIFTTIEDKFTSSKNENTRNFIFLDRPGIGAFTYSMVRSGVFFSDGGHVDQYERFPSNALATLFLLETKR
ncbi:hypothetical protein [Janthinobacterium fluminis]|uniref:Straight fiber protein PB4 spike domain-containing protein n=1 Tax=Janthinobacterium fluminis TaxID=2987524 RepID=A0ABT5K0X9_9BURK|nr:hypothetical protein [Janthinobacterium fluminis]MDC8758584.1 hypothetical protein [Janthinobacterium fluminis]